MTYGRSSAFDSSGSVTLAMSSSAISKSIAIVVIVLVSLLATVAAYSYSITQNQSPKVCNTCFVTQPVADLIIPSLVSHSNNGGATNLALNVTRGQNVSLIVEIFPSVPINVTMHFRILSKPSTKLNSSDAIVSSFTPETLSIQGLSSENCTLFLSFASYAPTGAYSVVVSAIDSSNSNWTWGTIFTINISAVNKSAS